MDRHPRRRHHPQRRRNRPPHPHPTHHNPEPQHPLTARPNGRLAPTPRPRRPRQKTTHLGGKPRATPTTNRQALKQGRASRFVVIEFPDMDRIRGWCDSPEYRRARAIREGKLRVGMLSVEGTPPEGFSLPAQRRDGRGGPQGSGSRRGLAVPGSGASHCGTPGTRAARSWSP
ncbi:DUF1330 domain-containing protein [Streptomyces albospinus]|uniref:DUF1330 domain-containing protein n=1 Tax=Streptomyces albospinus TaxID=285515 RepID=UPI00227D74CC|nr:DUF1330 domain-containing protein [Streptomyces albospinus]